MENPDPMILKINPARPEKTAVDRAVRALQEGKLVIIPTETVYGVAAAPGVAGALDLIYAAKERDRGKPIPWLAASLEAVEKAGGVLPPWARRLARRYWPGPLTLVATCHGSQEGFRVPDHPVALAVLTQAGGVLRVTSANLSGEPAARTAASAAAALGSHVALVLDAGPSPLGVESTVVEATGAAPVILRQGALSREAVMSRPRVLFVCTGNTCRSPMAEHLFRKWAGSGSQWEATSAGVAAMDGQPASEGAIHALAERDLDLSAHRSRRLAGALIDEADLVVVMTQSHKQVVLQRFPRAANRVVLLNEFNPRRLGEDVPDPFGMKAEVYRAIRDEIEAAMPDLVLHGHGYFRK
jgi:L-threonylcarbamoyladenylate synthase